MAIHIYNAVIINRSSRNGGTKYESVGVLRDVTSPVVKANDSSAYRIKSDDYAGAQAVTNGLFNSEITHFGITNLNDFFGGDYLDYNGVYKIGGVSYNGAITVAFPGGCKVNMNFDYNVTSTLTYYRQNEYKTIGKCNRAALCGLVSDSIYEYETTTSNGTVKNYALLVPAILPYKAEIERTGVYEHWFEIGPYNSVYPTIATTINDNSSDSDVNSFYATVDFIRRFWADVDTANAYSYFVSFLSGAGGIVAPTDFWAAANEPRMFTATPDEHHAIHSVTAYNTLTNQQIPLQESGMDLLTGAKNYMFTMPAANVRIIVEFRSIEITIPVTVKYTSPRGKVFTTSFNLLYDDTEQREETAPPVEEQEGENQNE